MQRAARRLKAPARGQSDGFGVIWEEHGETAAWFNQR